VLACVVLEAVSTPARTDVPAAQRAEVEHLLSFLRGSGCQMIRNGAAHDGEEAARHVQRKYDHFRDEITSTEEFVEHSASRSTVSGKAYRVQCPGEPALASRDWLLRELEAYRRRPNP